MSFSFASWVPSHTPTTTTLKSIATTHTSGLSATLSSAMEVAATATGSAALHYYSLLARGAQASLTIISAENVLATATDETIKVEATQAIFAATFNLKQLADEGNLYTLPLNKIPNIIYLVLFTMQAFYFIIMVWKSSFQWFNITFIFGYGLELVGCIGRVLSFKDNTDMNYYLLQFVALTIAPAFIMAGIYFIFAQCVVIYGRKFSVWKPMWYTYFFIGCDVVSLLIQAVGGTIASTEANTNLNSNFGKNTMVVGIMFQVVSMTIFLGSWFWFMKRCYFEPFFDKKLPPDFRSHPMVQFTPLNFANMLFNTKSAREYVIQYREPLYNQQYASIRERKRFHFLPLGITVAVIMIYIRCIYRVVELVQGFGGHLMIHEVYLMTLDALMIAICGFIFFPLHPVWTFGPENIIMRKTIHQNKDQQIQDAEKAAAWYGRFLKDHS